MPACGDGDGDGDSKADAGAADAGPQCGDEKACLDDKGKENLALCPNAVDYTCSAGCCTKIEKCTKNDECAAELGGVLCPDKNLLCICNLTAGSCAQGVCGVDGDCGSGKICNNGGCGDAPKATDVTAHLLRPFWIARPGDSVDAAAGLGAQARSANGAVKTDATFEWKLTGDAFKLEGGKLVATDKAGAATVTATVKGGSKASNAAKLWNLGKPDGKTKLRVAVADDTTLAPLTGKVIAIGMADKSTPAAAKDVALKDGVAVFDAIDFPVDVHVLADGHELTSVLRVQATKGVADLVVPVRPYHHADLSYDGKGKLLSEAELINGDVVTGKVNYKGDGEAGLGITSLGVGGDLLSFNIDALVGPSVKRPFNDKAPSLVNPEKGKPQDIPGGVSFLLGQPVVDSFVLAAPPGRRVLWSLAGRVPLSDLGPAISQIVGAVDGGLDVGKVVSALLPYLSQFYSQVVMDVEFKDKLTSPANTQDLSPKMPLGLSTVIKAPALPEVKKGQWADLILSVGGAMLPDGQFVPLGLTAGADAVDGAKPDGKVDGDPNEDGDQDLTLRYAPLHGGLRTGKTPNFALVHAAINVGGKDKREGGSIIVGKPGAPAKTVSPGGFLGYSAGSKYDGKKRTMTVQKVDGVAFYRVIMTGSKSQRWVIVVPPNVAGAALNVADLTKHGAKVDLAKQPKRIFVGAFETHEKMGFDAVVGPAGLTDLVRKVARTSFIDVH